MPRSFPGDFHHDATVNSQHTQLCHMCGKRLGPGMILWYEFAPDTLFIHPECGERLARMIASDLRISLEEEKPALPEPTVVDADDPLRAGPFPNPAYTQVVKDVIDADPQGEE